jgi:hypothetical protein
LVRSLYNKEKGKSYAKNIVSYILVDDIFIDSRNIYVRKKYDRRKRLSPIGSNIGRAFFLSVLFDTTNTLWYYEYISIKGETNGRTNRRT